MQIIKELLSSLDYGASLREIRIGPFQTAVFSRHCGLATTVTGEAGTLHEQPPLSASGSLEEMGTQELAGMALSRDPLQATVGMAAINSLLEVDEDYCTERNALEMLLERGQGRRMAIVGHFPFVSRLKEVAGELWVIEKRLRPGDITEEEGENVLPLADVVGITGSALTNRTAGKILSLCRPDAYVMLIGGTAPLSPLLFAHGVDAVAGTVVREPITVLKMVSQGATYRQLSGVAKLTMTKMREGR